MPDRRTIVREPDGGVRMHALVAFWTVILVSLPVWWLSTSIEHLSLPRLEPHVLAQLEVRRPRSLSCSLSCSALVQTQS